jgi:hypothetical protein
MVSAEGLVEAVEISRVPERGSRMRVKRDQGRRGAQKRPCRYQILPVGDGRARSRSSSDRKRGWEPSVSRTRGGQNPGALPVKTLRARLQTATGERPRGLSFAYHASLATNSTFADGVAVWLIMPEDASSRILRGTQDRFDSGCFRPQRAHQMHPLPEQSFVRELRRLLPGRVRARCRNRSCRINRAPEPTRFGS